VIGWATAQKASGFFSFFSSAGLALLAGPVVDSAARIKLACGILLIQPRINLFRMPQAGYRILSSEKNDPYQVVTAVQAAPLHHLAPFALFCTADRDLE
jgi:hypothetical protein